MKRIGVFSATTFKCDSFRAEASREIGMSPHILPWDLARRQKSSQGFCRELYF